MTPFVHIVIVLLLLGIAMSGAIFLDNYWLSILSAAVYFFVLLSRIEQLSGKRREVARTAWLSLSVTGLAAVGIALAVVLRRLAFTSDMGKFGRLVTLMADDPNHTISVFLGALGFYVKKFFLPLPLRFFILEVEPLYDFVGMAVLLGIALMIIRRTLPAVFILAGACMLAPSLPLAFGTVAWTGYAERYVYIAAAFWSVALFAGIASLKVFDGWVRWKKFVVAACTVTVVITFASVTFTRNLQWRHNTGILADTVNKAPRAKTIRIMYAFALLLENRIPEAKREADIARTLYSLEYDENVDIVTAAILKESGQLKEAESCYREAVQRTKFRSANALASIIRFYEDFLRDDQNDDARILKKLVFYAEKQAALTGNPYHFYKVGQYLLHQGDHAGAVTCFRKARDTFPPDNPFKGYSERILVKLCGNGTKKPCLPECRQINDKR